MEVIKIIKWIIAGGIGLIPSFLIWVIFAIALISADQYNKGFFFYLGIFFVALAVISFIYQAWRGRK